ncbi:IpaB/EvcA family protein [Pediococcus ethanolidurans]|uniref:IpaB/EvcA family protein n=1 Tax=Pediococcus ethanolidurans TaxID=319653 RepID=UPI0029541912|nr:IpaB/EvcA family protein [Pediococcus ethanolidurans]MDV7720124.1 IpaB/EvcA family protein [Pediococcus ethanolidurans]
MSDIKLNSEVKELLDEVNEKISGEVTFDYGTEKSGYVRYDQSYQSWQNGDLVIHIKDITAPNYTVSHELRHALLDATGYPMISFNLTSGHQDFDEQLMIVTTTLYDTVTHLNIYNWQKGHGLLTDEVQTEYLKGVQQTIKPEEKGKMDGMMHLRLLTLLDALVFYGNEFDKVADQFQHDYPISLQGAQKVYQELIQKPVDSPFALRRTVVKAFEAFDAQLERWNLPTVGGKEFVTLGSVFSNRQLRLEVRQLFQISHSEIQDKATKQRAYIGIGVTDQQNAFVLPTPPQNKSEAFFKHMYGMSVKDLFEQLNLPYSVR